MLSAESETSHTSAPRRAVLVARRQRASAAFAAVRCSRPEPCSSTPVSSLPPEDDTGVGRHRPASVPTNFAPEDAA